MKQQINSLTATRGFAALMVFIFHFGREVFPFKNFQHLFYNGNTAVSYFYVLSGFVLYLSYAGREFTYGNYLKKRFARIWPAYIVGLAIFVYVYLYSYKMAYTPDLNYQIIYSFFFIQAFFGDYALVLNTAAWSISVEMTFYVLFPLLLFVQGKLPRLFIAGAAILYVCTHIIFFVKFKDNPSLVQNWNHMFYHPVMHMHQFLIGMVGGYFFTKMKAVRSQFAIKPILIFALIIALIVLKPWTLHFEVGLISPLFMLFIMFLAIDNPKFLNWKPLVFFGEISYGIYILQFPVHEYLMGVPYLRYHVSEQNFFFVSLGILIIAAIVSYYLIEMPFRKLLTGKKRKAIAATGGE